MDTDNLPTVETEMFSPLPHVEVDALKKIDLSLLLPPLLDMLSQTVLKSGDKIIKQPAWWPDCPWIDELSDKSILLQEFPDEHSRRDLVRWCYDSLGQAHQMLTEEKSLDEFMEDGVIQVFICYFCNKDFFNESQMKNHEKVCSDKPMDSFAADNVSGRGRAANRAQNEFLLDSVGIRGDGCRIFRNTAFSGCKRKRPDKTCYTSSKDDFIEALNLLPTEGKSKLLSPSKSDSDCIVLTLDAPKEKEMLSPRSQKSLMSQLSRDVSSPRKSLSLYLENENSNDSPASYSESDESDDDSDPCPYSRGRNRKPLLSIAFSSSLGDRVMKYLKSGAGSFQPTVDDIEKYCLSELVEEPEPEFNKNKLRGKVSDWPVTYKPRQREISAHWYKFSRRDRREFMKILLCGMDRHSRWLLRLIKPCFVKLRKLVPGEIKRWTMKKPRRFAQVVPNGGFPLLMQQLTGSVFKDGMFVPVSQAQAMVNSGRMTVPSGMNIVRNVANISMRNERSRPLILGRSPVKRPPNGNSSPQQPQMLVQRTKNSGNNGLLLIPVNSKFAIDLLNKQGDGQRPPRDVRSNQNNSPQPRYAIPVTKRPIAPKPITPRLHGNSNTVLVISSDEEDEEKVGGESSLPICTSQSSVEDKCPQFIFSSVSEPSEMNDSTPCGSQTLDSTFESSSPVLTAQHNKSQSTSMQISGGSIAESGSETFSAGTEIQMFIPCEISSCAECGMMTTQIHCCQLHYMCPACYGANPCYNPCIPPASSPHTIVSSCNGTDMVSLSNEQSLLNHSVSNGMDISEQCETPEPQVPSITKFVVGDHNVICLD